MNAEELISKYGISDYHRLQFLGEDGKTVLQTLLKNLPSGAGLFEVGDTVHALYLNEAFFECIGYPIDRYEGYFSDIDSVLYKEDVDKFYSYMADHATRHEIAEYVIRGHRGDGSDGYFSLKGVPMQSTITTNTLYLVVISDVTAKTELEKQMEQIKEKNAELLLLQERYKILEATAHGLLFEYYPKKDTMIFSYNFPNNKMRKEIPDYSEYSKHSPLVHSSHITMFREALIQACTSEVEGSLEYLSTVSGGGYRWHRTYYKSVVGSDGKIASVIGRILDIHDTKTETDDLSFKAERDGLTNVYRKEAAFQKMQELLDEAPDAKFYFTIVDLDDFKKVNDEHGHKFGDDILKNLASGLVRAFGTSSIVGRFGGDEFIILTKGISYEEIAANLEKLKDLTHFSAGVVRWNTKEPIRACFERADSAMYHIKNLGKNGIEFAEEK